MQSSQVATIIAQPVTIAPITTAQSRYPLTPFTDILNFAINSYLQECFFYNFTGRERARMLQITCNTPCDENTEQGWMNVLRDIEAILGSSSQRLSDVLALKCCEHFAQRCCEIINSRELSSQCLATAALFNGNKKEFVLKDLIPQIRQDLDLRPLGAAARKPCQNTRQTPVEITPVAQPIVEATVVSCLGPLSEQERLQQLRMNHLFNRPDPITTTPVVTNNRSALYSPRSEPEGMGSGLIITAALAGVLGSS